MSEFIEVQPTFASRLFGRWRRRRDRSVKRLRGSRLTRAVESTAIFIAATALYLLVGEIIVRLIIHAPLFEIRDFRHARAAVRGLNQFVQYDSLLGWHLRPQFTFLTFHTLEYGFRSNGDPDTKVKPGGILAVGSSFTAGADVNDDQTWPAYLEQITGWNVNNAGEGNYVADQIILNGEQLLPVSHPQVLIVDLIPDSILGAGYSSYGWPKPYFTVENDALVQHNVPVPKIHDPELDQPDIKVFLGHFAIIDQFMTAFFSDSWFSSHGVDYTPISNDPVDVTCHLLDRLKHETDAANARLVLYLQMPGGEVMAYTEEPPEFQKVGKCANRLGITLVEDFSSLRELYQKDPTEFRKYNIIAPNGQIGHKSPLGNLLAAKAVEPVVRNLGIAIDQKSK